MENISPCQGCGKSLSHFLPECPSCGFVKPQPASARKVPDSWKPAPQDPARATPEPKLDPSPAGQKEWPPQPEHKAWRLAERPQPPRQMVVVTDIHMELWSMVVFLVKLAIAAIPALAILGMFFVVILFLLGLRR